MTEPITRQEQPLVDRLSDVKDFIDGDDWWSERHRQTCADAIDELNKLDEASTHDEEIERLRSGLRRIADSVNHHALYFEIQELLDGE